MSLDFTLVPQTCPHCGVAPQCYSGNYTHNAGPMWRLAGVYDALYNSQGKTASEITTELTEGVSDMTLRPETYIALNPSNGWGDYETALEFLKEVLEACKSTPTAVIDISR